MQQIIQDLETIRKLKNTVQETSKAILEYLHRSTQDETASNSYMLDLIKTQEDEMSFFDKRFSFIVQKMEDFIKYNSQLKRPEEASVCMLNANKGAIKYLEDKIKRNSDLLELYSKMDDIKKRAIEEMKLTYGIKD